MTISKLELPTYLKSLAVLLLIIIIIFTLIVAKSLLIPIFLAGFLSVLLAPISDSLERKNISREFSSIVALVFGIFIIAGIITFVIMQVSSFTRDLGNVGDKINTYLTDLDSFLISGIGLERGIISGGEQKIVLDFVQSNSSNIPTFIMNAIGSLASVILLPVFIFFFLVYRDHLTNFIVIMYKEHDKETIKSEIKTLRKVIQNYIIGIFKVMAILVVLNAAVLFGLGIQHAIFFAVFAAFLNIIPYLGPILGAVLPTIFAFLTKDSLFYPMGVVAGFMVIQMIESNFLTPKIVGSNVNLNAFITLLGLLVGAAIWGVIGMILIIPTLAVLRKIFQLNEATKPYAFLLGEENNDDTYDPTPV